MRKRYTLGAALTLVLVAVMAIGAIGSGAWFTDTETVTGITVTAGTLDLGVDVVSAFIEVENLAPNDDWTQIGVLTVTNNGSLNMKWRAGLVNVDDDGLGDYLEYKVNAVGYGPNGDIREGPVTEIEGMDNLVLLCAPPAGEDPWEHPFGPGDSVTYTMSVRLPSETGNGAQGKSYKADLQFFATQVADSW